MARNSRTTSPRAGARRSSAVALAVLAFVIYNVNFRDILIGDPVPTTLLPASLLREANLDLDEFRVLTEEEPYVKTIMDLFGAFQTRDGHLVSSYPVGAAILATPVYAVFLLFESLETWWQYRLAGKLAASLIVALSAGVVFLAVEAIAGARAAWVLGPAYAFGTSAWTVASQAMWQHGPGMLCLAIAVLMALHLERRPRTSVAVLMGAALGAAVLCRLLNIVPAIALGAFVLVRHWRLLPSFSAPLLILGTWLIWYNVSTFGELMGGYQAIYAAPIYLGAGLTPATAFSYPFWRGFAGIMISPSKGLLVFSPYLIFALVAVGSAWRAADFPLGRYLCAWLAIMLLILSKNVHWWGGGTYGPRYLSELLVPLTLLLAHLWPRIECRRSLMVTLGALLALSVSTQIVGAFFSPCGWDTLSLLVTPEQRLWDWSDPETLHCLSVGLEQGPKPFVFLGAH